MLLSAHLKKLFEGDGYLKVPVFSCGIIKRGFPFFKGKGFGHHTLCFQVPIADVFNDKGITVRAEMGTQEIQLRRNISRAHPPGGKARLRILFRF